MQFIDTHCHIQSASSMAKPDFTSEKWQKIENVSTDLLVDNAIAVGVNQMICVGCDIEDSILAVKIAQTRSELVASIGIHPHEAKLVVDDEAAKQQFKELAVEDRVVAVGECGLDYFYNHSPKADQIAVLEFQLGLALDNNLPVIFHVREAFDDFWPILGNFKGVRGVLHSYTDNQANLDKALSEGLYIGVNGIATFTKDNEQLKVYKNIPADRLLLETDAPYLTPTPFRGSMCQPKHIVYTAEFLSELRRVELEELASTTTTNARKLFKI